VSLFSRRIFNSKTVVAVFAAIAAFAYPALAQQPIPAGGKWDELLRQYVKPSADGVNRVDYSAWKKNKPDLAKLDAALAEMKTATPSKLERDAAMAYWINLYNAVTLKVILEKYPVASIRDIKSEGLLDPKAYTGPWRTKRAKIEGKDYSLDDIENNVLRPVYKDPRVHYAVNCASYGCPNLLNRAWSAATLDADLDTAAREFVNHPRGVTVLPDNKLKVSSIYAWFEGDFGGASAVLAHFRKYGGPTLIKALDGGATVADNDYIWTLAAVKPGS
jgi:Protein of unknown function, DUF547